MKISYCEPGLARHREHFFCLSFLSFFFFSVLFCFGGRRVVSLLEQGRVHVMTPTQARIVFFFSEMWHLHSLVFLMAYPTHRWQTSFLSEVLSEANCAICLPVAVQSSLPALCSLEQSAPWLGIDWFSDHAVHRLFVFLLSLLRRPLAWQLLVQLYMSRPEIVQWLDDPLPSRLWNSVLELRTTSSLVRHRLDLKKKIDLGVLWQASLFFSTHSCFTRILLSGVVLVLLFLLTCSHFQCSLSLSFSLSLSLSLFVFLTARCQYSQPAEWPCSVWYRPRRSGSFDRCLPTLPSLGQHPPSFASSVSADQTRVSKPELGVFVWPGCLSKHMPSLDLGYRSRSVNFVVGHWLQEVFQHWKACLIAQSCLSIQIYHPTIEPCFSSSWSFRNPTISCLEGILFLFVCLFTLHLIRIIYYQCLALFTALLHSLTPLFYFDVSLRTSQRLFHISDISMKIPLVFFKDVFMSSAGAGRESRPKELPSKECKN